MSGSPFVMERSASRSARGRRSSPPSKISAPSSSTKSTRGATNRAKVRATTRAKSRSYARAEGAVVVLGSATPSLESWANAQTGKYTLLTLPERVGGGRLPEIEVIDQRIADKTRDQALSLAARPSTLDMVL